MDRFSSPPDSQTPNGKVETRPGSRYARAEDGGIDDEQLAAIADQAVDGLLDDIETNDGPENEVEVESAGPRTSVSAAHRRRDALSPFLDALGPASHERTDDGPDVVYLLDQVIELEPWQRATLRKQWDTGDATPPFWTGRLLEGLAFTAKSSHLLAALRGCDLPTEERDPLLTDLMGCAAAGLALQEELQRDIDALVGASEIAELRKLTGYQHEIARSAWSIRELVGQFTFQKAEHLAKGMVGPAAVRELPTGRRKIDLSRLEEVERPTQFRRAAQRPRPTAPAETEAAAEVETAAEVEIPAETPSLGNSKRIRSLILLLAVTATGLLVQRAMMRPPPGPPVLTLEHFEAVPAIHSIQSRPPSLYVNIDSASWTKLTEEEQREALVTIGEVAGPFGYHGAHVRTAGGRVLGQWMATTGAHLREAGQPPS